MIAGVELGGTKAIAVVGRGRDILARLKIPTTTPAQTLGALSAQLTAWRAEYGFEAIGIASFGPIRVDAAAPDCGRMLATPKPGWAGADVLGAFRRPGVPIGVHTDVTAAALAEGAWGAARGCRSHLYVTVGTGIGFGVVADGHAVAGALHPEAGHIRVRRAPGDGFAGACPFHGDCLEGLASGPAIAARVGKPAAELGQGDPAWAIVADALAEGLLAVALTVAPERIVIGGGVGLGAPWLWPRVETAMRLKDAGYFGPVAREGLIAAAELGADAGPLGAMLLGASALPLAQGRHPGR